MNIIDEGRPSMSNCDRPSVLSDRVTDLAREVGELREVVHRLATVLAGIDAGAASEGERR